MYAFRLNDLFLRLVGSQVVVDGDLKTNNQGLLVVPDLWTATQWQTHQLKKLSPEIVELEFKEIRVIPPIMNG